MIAFNHVVPVLNLSVFNVRRAPAFAFEQSKRATIGGRFIRVDESRDLPLLHVVEDFTQKPVCSFAVRGQFGYRELLYGKPVMTPTY